MNLISRKKNGQLTTTLINCPQLFEGNPPETTTEIIMAAKLNKESGVAKQISEINNIENTEKELTTTISDEDIETTTTINEEAPELSDDSSFENELNQNKTSNATVKPKICNQTIVFGILLTDQVCM